MTNEAKSGLKITVNHSNYQEQQSHGLKATKKMFNEQHSIEPVSGNNIIRTLHVWMFDKITLSYESEEQCNTFYI